MKSALLLAVCAACTDPGPDLALLNAQVTVTDGGSGTVAANACLDAQLFSCSSNGSVSLVHDGVTTPMMLGGLLVKSFQAMAPVGDATTSYEIVADGSHATMSLPAAFDLTGAPSAPVTTADSIELRWQRTSALMQYEIDWACPNESGGGYERAFTDEGSLVFAMADINGQIGTNEPDPHATCTITLTILRFAPGRVDPGFRANGAAGIESRSVMLSLQR